MTQAIAQAPPYLRTEQRTDTVMAEVCVALLPPAVAAVWFFGLPAVWRLLTGVAAACATDRLVALLARDGRKWNNSAAVTGLILALSCPAGTSLWVLALGCVLAVGWFRDAFGGIGANLFNPAMAARAVMLLVFPALLGGAGLPDAVSTATPLVNPEVPLRDLVLGSVGGSLGETSVPLLLLGSGYLLYRRVIRWQVPVITLAAFCITMALCGENVLRQVCSGSILFAAVYIVTDYTGKPTTPVGEAVFAGAVGAACALFRLYGKYPEGVCFAVLCVNLFTPLIERYTRPTVYGTLQRRFWK